MPKKGFRKPLPAHANDPDGLVVWTRRFVEHLRVRAFSERTLITTEGYLLLFAEWAADRGLTRPAEITKPILEAHQRWLFYFRRPSGKPLGLPRKRTRREATTLRRIFRLVHDARLHERPTR